MKHTTTTTDHATPRRQTPAPGRRLPRFLSRRTKGQALLIVALAMTVIVLFVGLGVDVAFLMAKRSKLQSAVDSAALSAAQILYASTEANATLKAYQILEASGVPSTTLATTPDVGFPGVGQVSVNAVQKVDTFFMRLIPIWSTINIDAFAVADATSYAEIQAKPYGDPGVVSELNLMVWGRDSYRPNGDNYSPYYWSGSLNTAAASQAAALHNTEYDKQPYGYLFRIDVPADYSSGNVVVQIFDADTYNRPDAPPTPYPTPGAGVIYTPTPTPTPSADSYVTCQIVTSGVCTTDNGTARQNTGVKQNAYNTQPNKLPALWRVDENRGNYTGGDDSYETGSNPSKPTTTKYTLWHFNRRNTTAFGDPYTLTDYEPGGVAGPIASFTVKDDAHYDLRWYQPPNFNIDLSDFEQETNGKYYFYIYVQGTAGSSENNYDLRVGPTSSCTDLPSSAYSSPCYVNKIYYDLGKVGGTTSTLWNDGGAKIFAKRALPLNLDSGDEFPVILAQISKNAAGQTLGVRHFDQDCNRGCGTVMTYQMQKCGSTDLKSDSSWSNLSTGWVGGGDQWTDGTHPDPEPVQIPAEGSTGYTTFFGDGTCASSWLRIYRYPSYSQDTTVWELPFLRPRLVQ